MFTMRKQPFRSSCLRTASADRPGRWPVIYRRRRGSNDRTTADSHLDDGIGQVADPLDGDDDFVVRLEGKALLRNE